MEEFHLCAKMAEIFIPVLEVEETGKSESVLWKLSGSSINLAAPEAVKESLQANQHLNLLVQTSFFKKLSCFCFMRKWLYFLCVFYHLSVIVDLASGYGLMIVANAYSAW